MKSRLTSTLPLAALLSLGPAAFAQGDNGPFGLSAKEMLTGVDGATVQQLDQISRTIERNPNDEPALVNRAAIALKIAGRGRYTFQWVLFASKDLERAIRLAPNDFYARHNYAMACFQAGDVNSTQPNMHLAVIHFDKAIELKPDSARSYMGRGWTYQMLGENARANADFQTALRLDPSLRDQLVRESAAIREKLAQIGCVSGMMQRMSAYVVNRNARTADQCAVVKGYWTNGQCRISTAMAPGPLMLDAQNSTTGNRGLGGGNCTPPPDAVNDRYSSHAGGYVVK